jgi:N-acetylmuramoyl-L-alanine amidase
VTFLRQAGLLCAFGSPLFAVHALAQASQNTAPAQPAPRPLTLHHAAPATTSSTPQTNSRTSSQTRPTGQARTAHPAAETTAPGEKKSASSTASAKAPGEHAKAASALPSVSGVPINRTVVVLDPAHGGVDGGSRIGDSIQEKDVTLALAFKLRSLLTARGFTVVLTRDSDAATGTNPAAGPLTLDDRAGIANHARAVACLLIHATGSGTGAHLYSSELPATPGVAALEPWLTAQAPWVPQSQSLESHLGAAFNHAGIPLVMSSASVRPVDSLSCPALVVELAPRGEDPASIKNDGYQQRAAEALAGALVFWQNQAVAPVRLPSIPTRAELRHAAAAAEAAQP